MKKILLMSFSLLILALNALPSNSFASEYFSEETEGEFKDYEPSAMEKSLFDDIDEVFYHDDIDEAFYHDDIDEAFVLDYIGETFYLDDINDHADTEEKRPIINENAENILPSLHFQQKNYLKSEKDTLLDDLRMPPPLPLKSKFPNGRTKVELTEIEKKEIIRIHTAGPESLDFKNLNIRDRKTWRKMFDDGFSQDKCIKKMLNLKKKRSSSKRYRAKPRVKERRKKYDKKYNARADVKKRAKEYRRKRKCAANLSLSSSSKPEVTSVPSVHFSYASEKGEFTDSELPPMDIIHDENFTGEIFLPPLPPFVLMMLPPPLKSKEPNGRKKVELTEIEKNEIIRIHTAGPEGLDLNNLGVVARKTWQKSFDDGLSQDECFKKRLKQKKHREANKRYRENTEVKKRSKEYQKEYRSRPEVKKYRKEQNARQEVKKRAKEYRRKRKRNVGQEIDSAEKERPTKKRKI